MKRANKAYFNNNNNNEINKIFNFKVYYLLEFLVKTQDHLRKN
jgi:hypothetical protein